MNELTIHDTLKEIRLKSANEKEKGTDFERLMKLRLCKRHDIPLIFSSDAHISFQIADYNRILPPPRNSSSRAPWLSNAKPTLMLLRDSSEW